VLSQKLRRKDQLLQEANKGEVFNGYTEGALKFKPTYKYDVGSSIYDTSSHKASLNFLTQIIFIYQLCSSASYLYRGFDPRLGV
jgi:hypothetical protein